MYAVDILIQILLILLTFIALIVLRELSICGRWFLFGVNLHLEEWSIGTNMVSNIWFGMAYTNFNLLQFKSHL